MNKKVILGIIVVLVLALVGGGIYRQINKKQEKDVIKIGAILPLTGNSAEIADFTLKGLQYAIDEQNKNGGIGGRDIVLETEDSKSDPKEGVLAVNKILLNSDPVFLYSIISGVTMAIKPITEEKNKILVGAVGASNFLENSKYCIRNFVEPSFLASELSAVLADSLKASKVGIFYANTEYGKSVSAFFEKKCIQKGLIIKFNEPYDDKVENLRNLVLKYKNTDAEYIYVAGVGKGLGLTIKEIRQQIKNVKILGDEMIPYPDVINSAGNGINDVIYLDFTFNPESTNDPRTVAFINGFRSKFGKTPHNLSVIAYDFSMLFFKTLNELKSTDPVKIMNSLNNIINYEGTFGKMSFNKNNIEYEFTIKKMKIK